MFQRLQLRHGGVVIRLCVSRSDLQSPPLPPASCTLQVHPRKIQVRFLSQPRRLLTVHGRFLLQRVNLQQRSSPAATWSPDLTISR